MRDFLIQHWAAILDAGAKVVTIFAGIGLWVAYRQYKHSVNIAKNNERRAAVELAARECARFGDEITKKILALKLEIEKSGCDYLKHCKVIKEPEQMKLDTAAVTEDDNQKMTKLFPHIIDVLNALEGFAIPFASNVADDKLGFTECGRSFVAFFENLFPLYRVNLQDFYKSSQILYWRWKKLASQQDLERQHSQAGKEFFTLTAKLVNEKSKSRLASALASWFRKAAEQLSKPRP
jgi:hypothetical protein